MAQTLDLDQLSANVAEVVQRVLAIRSVRLLLYNEKRATCASATPWGTAKR